MIKTARKYGACPRCSGKVYLSEEFCFFGRVHAYKCALCGWYSEIVADRRIKLNGAKKRPKAEGRPKFYDKNGQLERILALMDAGKGNREISRITGASTNTIRKYRGAFEKNVLCRCGLPATHQGWCWVRYNKSAKRQEFIRKWCRKKTQSSSIILQSPNKIPDVFVSC